MPSASREGSPAAERGEEQPQSLEVEDRVRPRHLRRQHRPRLAGRAFHLRHEHDPGDGGRDGEPDRDHPIGEGRRHREPAEQGGGDVVRMALGPRGEREERVAVERRAEQGVARGEAGHPGGRARAEAAARRNAIHAVHGRSAKRPSHRFEGPAHALDDDVAPVGGEAPLAEALHRHGDPVGLLRGHVVVQGEGEAEDVEPRPEVRRGRRDAHVNGHELQALHEPFGGDAHRPRVQDNVVVGEHQHPDDDQEDAGCRARPRE